MTVYAWLSNFGDPIPIDNLEIDATLAFVTFVERYAADIAKFVEVRRGNVSEIAVFDIRTGRVQDAIYPVNRVERIGVKFTQDDTLPVVYMLREDFPDTAHQLLTAEDEPRAICIDDRTWSEARLTWTPAEMVHRILSWFDRAMYDKLHDPRQPLEPSIIGSPLNFFISRQILDCPTDLNLLGIHDVNGLSLRVCRLEDVETPPEKFEPIFIVAYRIAPEKMKRLTAVPRNFASLAEMLEIRGVELLTDLSERFSNLLYEESPSFF